MVSDGASARGGVSVSIRAEWARNDNNGDGQMERPNSASPTDDDDDDDSSVLVDVYSSVTKIGKNLGFSTAEIRRADGSRQLICRGSQIKFMPMGWLADTALSKYGWPMLSSFVDRYLSPRERETHRALSDCLESYRYRPGENSALFSRPEPVHASLGAPIHGGFQAVLLERAATDFVRERETEKLLRQQQEETSGFFELAGMSVDYLASARKGEAIEIRVETVWESSCEMVVRAQLYGFESGNLKSEGTLRFAKMVTQRETNS